MSCDGAGKLPCPACEGRGYHASPHIAPDLFTIYDCPDCKGTKVVECPGCEQCKPGPDRQTAAWIAKKNADYHRFWFGGDPSIFERRDQ